jgi:hypothetical protein
MPKTRDGNELAHPGTGSALVPGKRTLTATALPVTTDEWSSACGSVAAPRKEPQGGDVPAATSQCHPRPRRALPDGETLERLFGRLRDGSGIGPGQGAAPDASDGPEHLDHDGSFLRKKQLFMHVSGHASTCARVRR